VIVRVLLLVVSPAAMVRVSLLRVKSPATAGASGFTDTVRLICLVDGLSSLAVTIEVPPFSLIVRDESASVAVDRSSSVMVNVKLAGFLTPLPPDAVAWTVNSLSDSSMLFSFAVMVSVPLLVVSPATMVRVLLLKVKSFMVAGAIGITETVRLVAWPDGWLSIPVTVAALELPLSLMVRDESSSVSVGRSSSSVIVNVAAVSTELPGNSPLTVNTLSGASTSLSTAVMVSVPLLVVSPATMVRVLLFKVKSPATAGATGSKEIVRLVSVADGYLSVAVTVEIPPVSFMLLGES